MGRSGGIRRDHPATADYRGRRARTRQALCAKARRELGTLVAGDVPIAAARNRSASPAPGRPRNRFPPRPI